MLFAFELRWTCSRSGAETFYISFISSCRGEYYQVTFPNLGPVHGFLVISLVLIRYPCTGKSKWHDNSGCCTHGLWEALRLDICHLTFLGRHVSCHDLKCVDILLKVIKESGSWKSKLTAQTNLFGNCAWGPHIGFGLSRLREHSMSLANDDTLTALSGFIYKWKAMPCASLRTVLY